MKRYFETVKSLTKIAGDKFGVVIQMFISCGLYNLSSLLPPIAISGIIAVITNNNFNGIWYYALLYILFYVIYYSMLNWNYHTYTTLANYYHLEVKKNYLNTYLIMTPFLVKYRREKLLIQPVMTLDI